MTTGDWIWVALWIFVPSLFWIGVGTLVGYLITRRSRRK